MRVSTKGRLAVAAVIDLGLHQHRGPVTLASIGQRQQISISYLEQLFARLLRHHLVESTRGPGGGYRLVKPMESTSVGDIVLAVDDPPDPSEWAGEAKYVGPTSDSDQRCRTDELWAKLHRQMMNLLDSVSLLDLAEQQKNRAAHDPFDRRGARETSDVDVY